MASSRARRLAPFCAFAAAAATRPALPAAIMPQDRRGVVSGAADTERKRAREGRALSAEFAIAPVAATGDKGAPRWQRPWRRYSVVASAGFFSVTRQSWKPWVLIAFSIARRGRLCGGARSGRITPVACQGPCWAGSLLPEESPANARKSLRACDLNMKICIKRTSFQGGDDTSPRRLAGTPEAP